MSKKRSKYGLGRFLQGRAAEGLVETRLTEASSIACYDFVHPTYLETICVHRMSLKSELCGLTYCPTILHILGIILWLHSISGTKPSGFIQISVVPNT